MEVNANDMNEAKEEKTAEQILALYPALTKLLAYISGIEKTAIVLAMEEYARDQLSKEQETNSELRKRIDTDWYVVSLRKDIEKERKMKKELVESLVYISKNLGGLKVAQDEPESIAYHEALKAIKKASELDKK